LNVPSACTNESPTVTFTIKEFSVSTQELKITKKIGPMKYKHRKLKSKEYLSNFRLKKSKSKEDIPDDKKANKVSQGRRRSKSNEDTNGNIRITLLEKRGRKKGDYSSDECEREHLKSKKKKRRNSLSFKSVYSPENRSSMDESFLSKNSPTNNKPQKSDILLNAKSPTSKQQQYQILSDQLLSSKITKTQEQTLLGNHMVKNNNKSSEPHKTIKGILDNNHKNKSQADSMGLKPKIIISTDTGVHRTDKLQNQKTSNF